jgi:hypothetical protein
MTERSPPQDEWRLSYRFYEKAKGDVRSGSPLPIYQSEKGLGMRVARPTDEIQVLVRTVRFDVRFRRRFRLPGMAFALRLFTRSL